VKIAAWCGRVALSSETLKQIFTLRHASSPPN